MKQIDKSLNSINWHKHKVNFQDWYNFANSPKVKSVEVPWQHRSSRARLSDLADPKCDVQKSCPIFILIISPMMTQLSVSSGHGDAVMRGEMFTGFSPSLTTWHLTSEITMRLSLSVILLLSAVIILMLLIAQSEVGHGQFSSSREKESDCF